MKNKRKEQLNNRGAAMMVAVVIIGILMVFVFSLLLVSYTLFASQNKKVAGRRNSEAVNSLSQALETELTNEKAYMNSDLWKYLRCNLAQSATWPYYDPDDTSGDHGEEAAFRYFDLDYNYISKYFPPSESGDEVVAKDTLLDGFPGEVTLCVYWMLPENTPDNVKPVTIDDTFDADKIRLFVEINCNTASQSAMITNEYVLSTSILGTVDEVSLEKRDALDKIFNGSGYKETYNPLNLQMSEADKDWTWNFVGRQ